MKNLNDISFTMKNNMNFILLDQQANTVSSLQYEVQGHQNELQGHQNELQGHQNELQGHQNELQGHHFNFNPVSNQHLPTTLQSIKQSTHGKIY